MIKVSHSFEVHSNESACRKSGRLGLEQVTCHNMKIIVQTTGGDASLLNDKSEIPNNTLVISTRALLMNSSHKKEPW